MDWVKMRADLYRDPKVILAAEFLMDEDGELGISVCHDFSIKRPMAVTRNVMRNAFVGGLVSVWGVARQRGTRVGDDLLIPGATIAVIDDLADLPGMGSAMAIVGWAIEEDSGVVLPGFFNTYNSDPDDARSKGAARQRAFREREKAKAESNVTVTSRNALEEKRREKKRTSKTTTVADSIPWKELTFRWNEAAAAAGLQTITEFTANRKASYRARVETHKEDFFDRVIEEVEQLSEFGRGLKPGKNGKAWRGGKGMDLNFALTADGAAKLLEGNYRQGESGGEMSPEELGEIMDRKNREAKAASEKRTAAERAAWQKERQ